MRRSLPLRESKPTWSAFHESTELDGFADRQIYVKYNRLSKCQVIIRLRKFEPKQHNFRCVTSSRQQENMYREKLVGVVSTSLLLSLIIKWHSLFFTVFFDYKFVFFRRGDEDLGEGMLGLEMAKRPWRLKGWNGR